MPRNYSNIDEVSLRNTLATEAKAPASYWAGWTCYNCGGHKGRGTRPTDHNHPCNFFNPRHTEWVVDEDGNIIGGQFQVSSMPEIWLQVNARRDTAFLAGWLHSRAVPIFYKVETQGITGPIVEAWLDRCPEKVNPLTP